MKQFPNPFLPYLLTVSFGLLLHEYQQRKKKTSHAPTVHLFVVPSIPIVRGLVALSALPVERNLTPPSIHSPVSRIQHPWPEKKSMGTSVLLSEFLLVVPFFDIMFLPCHPPEHPPSMGQSWWWWWWLPLTFVYVRRRREERWRGSMEGFEERRKGVLTTREWCDPVRKISHHMKKGVEWGENWE